MLRLKSITKSFHDGESGLQVLRGIDLHLGFVFQQFNLLPGLNVSDNLLFQRRLNRLPPDEAWIDEISTVLGLVPLMNRPVEVLSSGQQQRVAIARALAHRPRVLFADEPTGNLHEEVQDTHDLLSTEPDLLRGKGQREIKFLIRLFPTLLIEL
jgi:ABC-type multidrug transport system ATPase subunit